MKDLFTNLLKSKKNTVLAALLVIFIVLDVPIPEPAASLIDSVVGKIVIMCFALCFLSQNTFLGILMLIGAYVLINRAGDSTGRIPLQKYVDGEEDKTEKMMNMNITPPQITVEEEVIANMIPRTSTDSILDDPAFSPVQDDLHEAARCD